MPADRPRQHWQPGEMPSGHHGGTNFQPPTFDPDLGLFFVTAHEPALSGGDKATPPIGLGVRVPSAVEVCRGHDQFAALRAIDPAQASGVGNTSTAVSFHRLSGLDWRPDVNASGLCSQATNDGYFYAFEAASGKELWRFQTARRFGARPPSPTCLTAPMGAHHGRPHIHSVRTAGRATLTLSRENTQPRKYLTRPGPHRSRFMLTIPDEVLFNV